MQRVSREGSGNGQSIRPDSHQTAYPVLDAQGRRLFDGHRGAIVIPFRDSVRFCASSALRRVCGCVGCRLPNRLPDCSCDMRLPFTFIESLNCFVSSCWLQASATSQGANRTRNLNDLVPHLMRFMEVFNLFTRGLQTPSVSG